MKELTKEEIKKLAEEYEALERWEQAKKWVGQYYDVSKVKEVVVICWHEFNDGDPTYPSVQEVEVVGQDGSTVKPDENHPSYEEYRKIYGEPDDYTVWVEWDGLPVADEGETYDLTNPPTLSFPKVVVLEEGESVIKWNISTTTSAGTFVLDHAHPSNRNPWSL